MDKLTCSNYVDFGKCQDRFGQVSWSTNDSNYLDAKLKVFKNVDTKHFRLVQNLTKRDSGFKHSIRWRNQLVIAADIFGGEQTLSLIQIPTMSKDMEEQLKLANGVVDVVDCPNRKICVTLLRYNADKPERSYARGRILARKKEQEKFQNNFL